MKLTIPDLSLVVLIGPSGCGKSTFAASHFKATEVLSSDACRGMVSDDENDQAATKDAFEVLHFIASKRLAAGRLTVIDATNVQQEARRPLVALAREYHCIPVAIVLNLAESICVARNRDRPDRNFGRRVVAQQRSQLRRSLRGLKREGFRYIYHLNSPEEVAEARIERTRPWTNRRDDHGPFDIIGDIHGCGDELIELLSRLGYKRSEGWAFRHAGGRRVVFLGDIVDRGPRILDCYRIVKETVEAGAGLCVPGNHENKLIRKLKGRKVTVSHGLEQTLAEIEALPDDERDELCRQMAGFFDGLVSHFVLDDGKLVVAHAGMKEEYQGRASGRVRAFALYGETTGETDEFGLPVRYNWAADYRGRATVVYGHTPVPEAEWLNRTICLDTGCVFGGKLTALRYPEMQLVSVPAARTYIEPVKPLGETPTSGRTAQQEHDDLLDMEDVSGKRIVSTGLVPSVTIREENAVAALEAMSRFAVDPRWLVYLPPTMAPPETSQRPDLLEHPDQVFEYFLREGAQRVMCQEKHMGSRAIVIVCREPSVARSRFGIEVDTADRLGVCFTRTGRPFFEDRAMEAALLERVAAAVGQAGLWDSLDTAWLVLDCELMPWSAKAQELLRQQYAAVGAAATAATSAALDLLRQAGSRGMDVGQLAEEQGRREEMVRQYRAAYRQYCWPVNDLSDLRLAPFHVLASEGAVHADKGHDWHMQTIESLCAQGDPALLATNHRTVDLADEFSRAGGVAWWEELTARGGEGMVVKPLEFIRRGKRGLMQPAVKCRGREYLRIIYGPEYTAPENLERLRARGLSRKRSLAIREFALGIEALERFVRREPLRRIHECVFGVLALESEPVDPRL